MSSAVLAAQCECWNRDATRCTAPAMVFVINPEYPDSRLYTCPDHAYAVNRFWAEF